MRVLRFRLEEGATGTCSHAHSARAPVLSLRRVLLQHMFRDAWALSDCNKIAIDASFSAALASWFYSTWSSLTCS